MPARRSMSLEELLRGLADGAQPAPHALAGDAGQAEISSLAYDSRTVSAGALFFCVPGFEHDGHEFAAAARDRGAAALVCERDLALGIPEVQVPSVRAAMGPLAARFYGDPSAELTVVGVTGTNGKTTTAYLVRALLEHAGVQCGLLGTVTSVIGRREEPVARTTPEAIDLQSDLRAMLDAGDAACAMEVSSHALALSRTDGVHFAAAIFTNLTQDHLDFHRDMEGYFLAKRRLFLGSPGIPVINVGDPYGQRLAAELPAAVTFAVEGEALPAPDPDYFARGVRCEGRGSRFVLDGPEGEREMTLSLPGRFNVANALGALAAVHRLGVDLDVAARALAEGLSVPGRVQAVDEGQGFTVLVDYAHTPDSLARVLEVARELAQPHTRTEGGPTPRLLCVFGAGGDRDRGKRGPMGEAAAHAADVVVVTSDNPRSEDPDAIIADVLRGVRAAAPRAGEENVQVLSDRRQAIARAIELACSGDVLVIAGKGHEQGQELAGGRIVPFDDVSVARDALRSRRAREGHTGRAGAPA
jgi:UDP-N-acetylmuramoyl-L-alanyl-D-glutamate--2,6-diaminopimelate ligase